MWKENQFPYFCWMILCGACVMAFYDILRISRRIVKHSDFLVNLEDMVYVLGCAVATLCVTYAKNNGEFRFQTFAGLATGGTVYFAVVKNRFVVIGTVVAKWIGKVGFKTIKICLYPFFVIFKIIIKPTKMIIWYTGKSYKSVRHKTELKIKNVKKIMKHK